MYDLSKTPAELLAIEYKSNADIDNYLSNENLQEKIVKKGSKWQVQENLDTFDDLSSLCKKLNQKHNAFGGNCGHFALALARELVKQGFDEHNFGIAICSSIYDEDLEEYNYSPRAYEETESDIYHVAINFGNTLFDGDGKTSIAKLKKIAKEEYGDANPNIYTHTYTKENDDDFRYAFEWGTNYDVYPEYYQKLIQKEFKTLVEKIVKVGSKWQVQSEKGKNLGTYDTKKEAEDRLKQVHYFKHINESNNNY